MVDYIGRNSIENLSQILKEEQVNNVLIFTGKKSYETIKQIVENQLGNLKITYYNNFSTNPKKEEIDVAIQNINGKFDIIIAIGGGSVIDFAKAFRYYSAKDKKLIAIPTTSGTGSEATQFAVVYVNGVKTSLDSVEILPEYAIIDAQFAINNPRYLKACTAMDAFCQAIESYWAVKSTTESRRYAEDAIKLCKDNIIEYVNTSNIDAAEKMALASNLAGKAINISRTTAAHALSYKITSEYGIPHGHAVALNILGLIEINKNINEENVNDSRGYDFVKEKLFELETLLCIDFVQLMQEIGLEMKLNKLGIDNIDLIASSVNPERLSNNPKKLTEEDLLNILMRRV